jgi:hypothetical protein
MKSILCLKGFLRKTGTKKYAKNSEEIFKIILCIKDVLKLYKLKKHLGWLKYVINTHT